MTRSRFVRPGLPCDGGRRTRRRRRSHRSGSAAQPQFSLGMVLQRLGQGLPRRTRSGSRAPHACHAPEPARSIDCIHANRRRMCQLPRWPLRRGVVNGRKREHEGEPTSVPPYARSRHAASWLDDPNRRRRRWRGCGSFIRRCALRTSRAFFAYGAQRTLPGGKRRCGEPACRNDWNGSTAPVPQRPLSVGFTPGSCRARLGVSTSG